MKSFITTPLLADKIVRRIYEGTSPFDASPDDAGGFSLRVAQNAKLSKKVGSNNQPSPFVIAKTKVRCFCKKF